MEEVTRHWRSYSTSFCQEYLLVSHVGRQDGLHWLLILLLLELLLLELLLLKLMLGQVHPSGLPVRALSGKYRMLRDGVSDHLVDLRRREMLIVFTVVVVLCHGQDASRGVERR